LSVGRFEEGGGKVAQVQKKTREKEKILRQKRKKAVTSDIGEEASRRSTKTKKKRKKVRGETAPSEMGRRRQKDEELCRTRDQGGKLESRYD